MQIDQNNHEIPTTVPYTIHKHRKISKEKKNKTPDLLIIDVKVDVEKVP